MRNRNNASFLKGFTLIELVVVVIIIGILAAIALPRHSKTVEKSKMAEATSMLGVIREAQMRYLIEYDEYADDFDFLDLEEGTETGKYFTFEVFGDPDAVPYNDVDEVIAQATRYGEGVGGGFEPDYCGLITERGIITFPGILAAPPPPPPPQGGGE